MRYLCQLGNEDLAFCRQQPVAMATSDVTDYVRAPAVYKRLASGDVSAIMELCGSYGHQSACFNRYLKNFARHITTSGNRFVGR